MSIILVPCKTVVRISTAHQLLAAFHVHLALSSAIFSVYPAAPAVHVVRLFPIAPALAAITGDILIPILNASPVQQVAPTA